MTKKEKFKKLYPLLEMAFFEMSNPDLVAWAINNGYRVRGMNRREILEVINTSRQKPSVSIANRPNEPVIYNAPEDGGYREPENKTSMGIPLEDVAEPAVPVSPPQSVPNIPPDGMKEVPLPKGAIGPVYVPEKKPPVGNMTWNELQTFAKGKGVKVFGRKRSEIEKELKNG